MLPFPKKAFLLLFWVGVGCFGGPYAPQSYAQTLTKLTDMSFGMTDVAANPPNSTLQLGPNATITYGPNLQGSGSGTAASVQLAGTTGQTIELRCTASATLTRAGGGSMTLSPVKISLGTPQSYGAATDCNGTTTTVITSTLSATSADNIVYMGGQLSTGSGSIGGTYSTTNVGGSVVELSVIFI
jgi:hypothetical protein